MVLEKLKKEQELTEEVLLGFINEMREFKTEIRNDVHSLRVDVKKLLIFHGLEVPPPPGEELVPPPDEWVPPPPDA